MGWCERLSLARVGAAFHSKALSHVFLYDGGQEIDSNMHRTGSTSLYRARTTNNGNSKGPGGWSAKAGATQSHLRPTNMVKVNSLTKATV